MRNGTAFLIRKASIYYFRMKVPDEFRTLFGKAEVRRSLGTGYLHAARLGAMRLAVRLKDFFQIVERNRSIMKELTAQDINDFLDRWLREDIETEEDQLTHRSRPYSPDEHEDEIDVLGSVLADKREELALCEYKPVMNFADQVLRDSDFKIDHDSDAYRVLCREMLKAQIVGLEIAIAQRWGNFKEVERLKAEASRNLPWFRSSESTERTKEAPASPVLASKRLSEALQEYSETMVNRGIWKELKTKRDYDRKIGLFIEVVGDIPMSELTREKQARFHDVLLRLPGHRNKKPEYRGKNIEELLAMSITETLDVRTINDYLSKIGAFLNWSVDNETGLSKNFLGKMRLKDDSLDSENTDPFTQEDLTALFRSEYYLKDKHSESFKFWTPIIALFTGMRANEICQLHLSDIKQIDGIWVFEVINDTEDKKVKGKTSKRLIPLHPVLSKTLRLTQYVESLKARGEERLFPELKHDDINGYVHKVSKWFNNDFKIKCGIPKTSKEVRKVFHSFRHTFVTHLMNKLVNETLLHEVSGHSLTGELRKTYRTPGHVRNLLNEIILKLDYEIDLSHLSKSKYVPR